MTVALSRPVGLNATTARRAPRLPFAALVVLLVAFGVRLILLGDQNVWWDEAFSLQLVREPLLTMLVDAAHDTHPPLYYLLLEPWLAVGGDNEFTARLLSVFAGTIAVAAVFAAGRLLAGLPGGVVAGAVLALSRLAVWWSQEARMYALAVAFLAIAAWAAIRFARSSRRHALVIYAVAAPLALLSVYISGAALLGLGAGAGLALIVARRGRDLAWWLAANVAAGVAVVPWLALQLRLTPTWSAGGEATTAADVLRAYLVVLPTGVGDDLDRWSGIALALAVLFVLAGLATVRARSLRLALPIITSLVTTPAVIWVSLLPRGAYYQPPFSVRYFVVATPAFAIMLGAIPLLASALVAVRRAASDSSEPADAASAGRRPLVHRLASIGAGALATAAVVLTATPLPEYFAPRHRVDDLQSMALAFAIHREPGDAALLVSGDRAPVWEHAVRSIQPPIEWTGAPWQQPADVSSVRDEVSGATAGARRVWLAAVDSQLLDPRDLVRGELARRYGVLFDERFGPNRLTLFALPGASLEAALPNVLARRNEGPLVASYLPVTELRPGEEAVLTLLVRGPLTPDQYVELREQRSADDGAIIERRPLRDVVPDRLASADLVRVPYRIATYRYTPGGTYEAVLNTSGESIAIDEVTIARTDPVPTIPSAAADLGAWRDERIGPGRLALAHADIRSATCGDARGVRVDLGLRLEQPLTRPYTLFVQLVGSRPNPATGNPVWSQHDGRPLEGELPVTQFPMDGRAVLERVCLSLPAALPAGSYQLIAGWYDATTGERLPFEQPAGPADHAVLWSGTSLP